jgi:hypothetical protein
MQGERGKWKKGEGSQEGEAKRHSEGAPVAENHIHTRQCPERTKRRPDALESYTRETMRYGNSFVIEKAGFF